MAGGGRRWQHQIAYQHMSLHGLMACCSCWPPICICHAKIVWRVLQQCKSPMCSMIRGTTNYGQTSPIVWISIKLLIGRQISIDEGCWGRLWRGEKSQEGDIGHLQKNEMVMDAWSLGKHGTSGQCCLRFRNNISRPLTQPGLGQHQVIVLVERHSIIIIIIIIILRAFRALTGAQPITKHLHRAPDACACSNHQHTSARSSMKSSPAEYPPDIPVTRIDTAGRVSVSSELGFRLPSKRLQMHAFILSASC